MPHLAVASGAAIGGVGDLELDGGSVVADGNNAVFTNTAAHWISGTGTLTATNGSLKNGGTIAPGAPIGQLTTSLRLAQLPTAVIEIELAGEDAAHRDLIINKGLITLDGTLRVRFRDGFEMAPCSELPIISGGKFLGRFASIDAPQMPLGSHSVRYLPSGVMVVYNAADHNGSGWVDTDDFTAFITDFEAGKIAANIDHLGSVDTDDFTAFMLAFDAGC